MVNRKKYILLSFFFLTSQAFAGQEAAVVAPHAEDVLLASPLELRGLSLERITSKQGELADLLGAVYKRRTISKVVGGSAVIGVLGWLTYRWMVPAPTHVSVSGVKQSTGKSVDAYEKELLKIQFDDYKESKTFKGMFKQVLLGGVSVALASLVLKRFNSFCDGVNENPTGWLSTFWGLDSGDFRQRYALSLVRNTELIQDALEHFESGIALTLHSSGDKELLTLLCDDLHVAWEGLVVSFENILALMTIVDKEQSSAAVLKKSRSMQHFIACLQNIIGYAEYLVQASAIGKQEQTMRLVVSQKLGIAAKQVADSIITR